LPFKKLILVVVLTILKNMKINGKDEIPYIVENKKCLKPPTRICDDLCNIPRDGWCPALDSWPGG